MTYSCSDFTDDVMLALAEHIALEPVDDDNPEQQGDIAVTAIHEVFNAGGTLASIVDSFLNGQGAVTVEEMDAALTAWHALVKPTDATSIQNRLAYSCRNFTDDVMRVLGESLTLEKVEPNNPEQQARVAIDIIRHLIFCLAKVSVRLRDPRPITAADRRQLRAMIAERAKGYELFKK